MPTQRLRRFRNQTIRSDAASTYQLGQQEHRTLVEEELGRREMKPPRARTALLPGLLLLLGGNHPRGGGTGARQCGRLAAGTGGKSLSPGADRGEETLAKVGPCREGVVAPPSPGPHRGVLGGAPLHSHWGRGPQEPTAQQWCEAPTTRQSQVPGEGEATAPGSS